MKRTHLFNLLTIALSVSRFSVQAADSTSSPVMPRQTDGKGAVAISGESKQWHKVTLTLDGPFAHERDTLPNPFTDLAFNVTFTHESGSPKYTVPATSLPMAKQPTAARNPA